MELEILNLGLDAMRKIDEAKRIGNLDEEDFKEFRGAKFIVKESLKRLNIVQAIECVIL